MTDRGKRAGVGAPRRGEVELLVLPGHFHHAVHIGLPGRPVAMSALLVEACSPPRSQGRPRATNAATSSMLDPAKRVVFRVARCPGR